MGFHIGDDGYLLAKSDLNKLLTVLKKYGEIIAPVHDGVRLRMQPIKSAKEITWEGISWFTSKKYLFPQKHNLFTFKGNKLTRDPPPPKRVLFGMRLCDLNAINVNDKLFLEQKPENHTYAQHRKGLTLVGLWCDEQQDKYCFCDSMELKHIYDICLFDKYDNWHIKAGSEKGEEILKELKLESDKDWRDWPDCEMELKTKNIKKFFDNNTVWKKGAEDCLSCGDCTTLCPTCLCFDIEDEMELDMVSGVRRVQWDSCMYKDFSLVAGGHVYRNTRLNRFKHRIYHKLDYFPDKYEQYMCTGCGRCIRGCPTKIDWISLVNEMHDND